MYSAKPKRSMKPKRHGTGGRKMSYFPTDIPFMSEEELKANGIKVSRPEEPNELGLRNCPFCGKEAKVRMTNYRVVATPSGIKPYFAVTYTLGCFDCGVKFSYESKFEPNNAGTVTITQDGYKEAADKWNRRGEE
jgi:hypothetical protein